MAFLIYAFAMAATFVIPMGMTWASQEWSAVRNWQMVATLIPALVVMHRKERFLQFTLGDVPRTAWRMLYAASLAGFVASTLSRYGAFGVNAYDFSIFDLGLFHTWNGRIMYNPVCACNHLATHLTWNILPLAPLVALFKSHYVLLVLHAVVVWSAAFPLRRIAARHLQSERLTFLVVLAYLASSRVGSIVGYPFHFEALFLPLGFWMIDGWQTGRIAVWGTAALGIWTTKEDAALYVLGFALGELVFGESRRRRAAATLALSSAVVFAVTALAIHPEVQNSTGYKPAYLGEWSRYGATLTEAALGMLAAPHQVAADVLSSRWHLLFGAMLLLPLLSPRAMIAMAPALVILSTSSVPTMRGFGLYYSAPLLPFLFWGLIDAGRFVKARPFIAVAAVLSPLIGAGYVRYSPVDSTKSIGLEELKASLSVDRPYCAQSSILPHLPYELSAELLNPACLARADATWILNPALNAYPHDETGIKTIIESRTSGGKSFQGGFLLLAPPDPTTH